jgi:hypothetical protein
MKRIFLFVALLPFACEPLAACSHQPDPVTVLDAEFRAANTSCIELAHTRPEAEVCLAAVRAAFAQRWADAQKAAQ